ncbi:hypothetical protein [Pseudoroseicyclus aestuarii]|nr:hypothetical protein [Pseudoroseicyclus aestuarii]
MDITLIAALATLACLIPVVHAKSVSKAPVPVPVRDRASRR